MTANAAPSRAYRLRKKASLTPDERAWLTQYDANKKPNGRKVKPRPAQTVADARQTTVDWQKVLPRPEIPPAEVDAPSRGYDYTAPPALTERPQSTLADFSDADGPAPAAPGALDTSGAAPDATGPVGCGVCAGCRSAIPAPVCALSGSTVPRPLSDADALGIAKAAFTALRISIAMSYSGHMPGPASKLQEGTAGNAIAQLSHRYDMQFLSDIAPFVMLAQSMGGYAVTAAAESKALKSGKSP